MLYRIVSPSDSYTLKSDDEAIACVAVLLLGDGKYGMNDQQDNEILPLMPFGDVAEKWLRERFNIEQGALYLKENAKTLAKCLNSVIIGEFKDREAVEKSIEEAEGDEAKHIAWFRWHNSRRTSEYDIGQHARNIAARLMILAIEDTNV